MPLIVNWVGALHKNMLAQYQKTKELLESKVYVCVIGNKCVQLVTVFLFFSFLSYQKENDKCIYFIKTIEVPMVKVCLGI